MKLTRASAAIFLSAAFAAPPAMSSVLADMNSMFMSNSTAATTLKTRDRVGIVGGGFSMRTPVKSITIIAFDAPRLNAGCGGVDLFGGSFSFINSQQLVQIFRQVAANAAGLAFKAAIKSISPALDALMSEFQTLMQNMNNLAKNSCQLAHLIVDPAAKSISNAIDGDGNVGASQKGMFSDAMASLTGYLADANSYLKKQGEVNPVTGNQTIKALMKSGAANILGLAGLTNFDGSSDSDTDPNSLNNRLLISFLGWEVSGIPCQTANEDGTYDTAQSASNNNLPKIACRGPKTIDLDQLVKGGGTGSIRESTPLTLYRCLDPQGSGTPNGGFDPQICTKMKKENFHYHGIEGWVNKMLFGTATVYPISSSSIVGKVNAGSKLQWTAEQVQFMKQSGLPLVPLLMRTSSPDARVGIAQRLGVWLTDCIAARFGEAIYKAANTVEYGHSHEITPEIRANIESIRTDYMARQNACLKEKTVLGIAQELIANSTLVGNIK